MDLIDFYAGAGPDNRGRMLDEILGWTDERLEYVHDYIQWLFPLNEGSAFNANAPILDASTIAEFRRRPELQKNLRRAFARMVEFYGLSLADGGVSKTQWLTPGNHNHLRITRILKSLQLLGLEREAASFFAALTKVREAHRDAISDVTYGFWMRANSGSSIMEVHSN